MGGLVYMNNTPFTPHHVPSATYQLTQCELTLTAALTAAKAPLSGTVVDE